MELQFFVPSDKCIPDMMIDSLPIAETKPSCDSRYRSIIDKLDVMIEQLHQQPDCNLTTEMDRLVDAMMDHTAAENRVMELVQFPHAVKHKLNHSLICLNTAELTHRFSKRKELLHDELTQLRILWQVHIHVHDRAFEEYLASSR